MTRCTEVDGPSASRSCSVMVVLSVVAGSARLRSVDRMQVSVGTMVSSHDDIEFVRDCERLGVSTVWVPEVWGYDAMTPLAHLAALTDRIRLATGIVQLGARTPAMLAMQAMSLQQLSGGRFVLGVGTSGPRIMNAWHGVPFARPIELTRETIDIVRMIARGDRLEYEGSLFHLPPPGAGKGIRSLAPACEPIPMFIASLGPRNLRLTGEIADGWLGNAFMPETAEVFLHHLREGCDGAGRRLEDLELAMPVAVEFTDDVEGVSRRHANGYAFTIGSMGSKSANFYSTAFAAQGFADEVAEVAELWAAGRREEAERKVPIEIGFRTNLLGTPEIVKERIRLYRDVGITMLQAKVSGENRRDVVAQLVDLVAEVNAE